MIDFFSKAGNFLITKYERIFFLIFLIIGAVLRLPYITKPFWYDEVWRIGSISENNFLYFIINQQEAPISLGLALVTKFMITVFGNTEIPARLFIMILGILIPALAFLIVKKLSRNSLLALFSMFAFTIFPDYIIHSTELKPFVIEVTAVFLLFLVFDKFWQKDTLCNYYKLATVILAELLFATPIIFFFPVLFLLLFYKFWAKKNLRNFIYTAALSGITFILSFLYFKFYLNPQTGSGLFEYWRENFVDNPGLFNYLHFLIKSFYEIFAQNILPAADFIQRFFISKTFIAGGLFIFFVLGNFYLAKIKRIYLSIFILGGAATVILFNVLKIWPFGAARVNLFLFSFFTFCTILGIYEFLIFIKTRSLRKITTIIFILVFAGILPYRELAGIFKNRSKEYQMIGSGMRDAVEYIKTNLQQNDNITVYHFLAPAGFNYYYYHYDFQNPGIRGPISNVRHYNDNRESAPYRDEEFFKSNLVIGERLWILMMDGMDTDDVSNILDNAEKFSAEVKSESRKFGDVEVYLYNGGKVQVSD